VKIVDYVGSKNIEMRKSTRSSRRPTRSSGSTRSQPGAILKVKASSGDAGREGLPVREVPRGQGDGRGEAHHCLPHRDGPKVKIGRMEFDGNRAIGDFALRRQLKTNKPKALRWITAAGPTRRRSTRKTRQGRGVLPQPRLHRRARGRPQLKYLEDSTDRTSGGPIVVPVIEGDRYRVATSPSMEHHRQDRLPDTLFKVKPGKFYSDKVIRKDSKRRGRPTAPSGISSSGLSDCGRDVPEAQQEGGPRANRAAGGSRSLAEAGGSDTAKAGEARRSGGLGHGEGG